MSAFLAVAADVPRKIRTSWLFWILLVLGVGIILFLGLSVNVKPDKDVGQVATFWGQEIKDQEAAFARASAEKMIAFFIGSFLDFFVCYAGVFAGLVLMADAVTSAFGPGQAELNIPKPVHRATLILARHTGALFVATFFAVLVVAGTTLTVYLRTKIFVPHFLALIPVSVAGFAILHALGAISGIVMRNALFGVFGSVGVWIVAVVSNIPNWPLLKDFEKIDYPLLVTFIKALRVTHRILPRPNDLPDLSERIMIGKFGVAPHELRNELELIGNALGWWALALVLAILVVRRRDF